MCLAAVLSYGPRDARTVKILFTFKCNNKAPGERVREGNTEVKWRRRMRRDFNLRAIALPRGRKKSRTAKGRRVRILKRNLCKALDTRRKAAMETRAQNPRRRSWKVCMAKKMEVFTESHVRANKTSKEAMRCWLNLEIRMEKNESHVLRYLMERNAFVLTFCCKFKDWMIW